MSATKHNKDKPQIGYLHPATMAECAYAHQAGEVKYGRYNYLKGHSERELLEAAIRHLQAALWEGESDMDSSSRIGRSVSHVGCVLANMNMLLTQKALGTLKEDAPFRALQSVSTPVVDINFKEPEDLEDIQGGIVWES